MSVATGCVTSEWLWMWKSMLKWKEILFIKKLDNALKCLQILLASAFPSFLETNQKTFWSFWVVPKQNKLYSVICLNFIDWSCFPCLKTVKLMFYFASNEPETEIPASSLFLGANLTEGIGFSPMIFSASWHSLLFMYQIHYLLNQKYK